MQTWLRIDPDTHVVSPQLFPQFHHSSSLLSMQNLFFFCPNIYLTHPVAMHMQ
jgi:hypothetical protein